VLAWHKTPTTSDIQQGVEAAIAAVVTKAAILPSHVDSIHVGTTVRSYCNFFGSFAVGYSR
jgi:hypothetical protein